jgi:eukaryotic-like serine/threonine-protein kinase
MPRSGNGDHADQAPHVRLQCENVLKVQRADGIDAADAFFITPFCKLGDFDDAMPTQATSEA